MGRNTWDLKQLKNLRLARHWSQEELAESSGLSTRTIQRIERGHKVDIGSIKLLAKSFNVEVNDLLGGDTDVSLGSSNTGLNFVSAPKKVASFYFALLFALITITLKLYKVNLQLNVNSSLNFAIWIKFMISFVAVILLLGFVGEKSLGPGVSRRFINKVFRGQYLSETPLFLTTSRKSREIIDIAIILFLSAVIMFL
ncbi:helix-turn-helix domain-containing protein [Roseivirga sp.]|uniref:helix-turn-helix domain-containing protein n=1 Tax=Roseivirga sp. TaxID=1964215 RepID=UPI003B8B3100